MSEDRGVYEREGPWGEGRHYYVGTERGDTRSHTHAVILVIE